MAGNGVAVKICGLTRPEDARAAAAAGADAVGVVFAPSPRRVTPARARRVLAGLPDRVLRVGVFVDAEAAWARALAEALGLDRWQFHGRESADYLRGFSRLRVIRALAPALGAAPPRRHPCPQAGALLVDARVPGAAGGTGHRANWVWARELRRFGAPVILSGGLRPDNVAAAVRSVRPDMVDTASGVESRPGVKRHAALRAFIRAAKAA